jgi:hypothetical protein
MRSGALLPETAAITVRLSPIKITRIACGRILLIRLFLIGYSLSFENPLRVCPKVWGEWRITAQKYHDNSGRSSLIKLRVIEPPTICVSFNLDGFKIF